MDLFSTTGLSTIGYILIFVVGVIGNSWVIVTLCNKRLRKSVPTKRKGITERSRAYIGLLTVSNLMLLSTIPLTLHYTVTANWIFGYQICKLFSIFEYMSKLVCPIILTGMAMESYLAVLRPFLSNRRFAYPMVILVLIAVALPIVSNVYYTEIEHVEVIRNGTIRVQTLCMNFMPDWLMPYVVNYMLLFAYVLPLILMIGAYGAMLCRIRRFYQDRLSIAGAPIISSVSKTPREPPYMMQLKRTVLRIVLFHFISWTPYWVFTALPTFAVDPIMGVNRKWLTVARMAVNLLPFINAAGNWILYALLNQQLMEQIGSSSNPISSLLSWKRRMTGKSEEFV